MTVSRIDVKLKLQRLPETGEYKVQWFEDGVLDEDKSYYTDDHEDALLTMRSMAEEAYRAGYKSVEAVA